MSDTIFAALDHIDNSGRPVAQLYDERLELVQAYDKAGLYAYHLTEHHFTNLGMAPSPAMFLSAASRVTKDIRLVPTNFIMPTYHPLRLAEDICMLDQLSHGRMEFAAGRGIVPHEVALYGVNPFESHEMLAEVNEIVMQAITTGKVDFKGHYYRFFKIDMQIDTVQKPHPPIWITSGSPAAAAVAGRKGQNMLFLQAAKDCRPLVDAFWKGYDEAKPEGMSPKLGLVRMVHVAETQAEAEEIGARAFATYFDNHSEIWRKYDPARGYGDDSRYTATGNLIFGTPDSVAEQIAQQFEEGGDLNYFAGRFAFGDLTLDETMRSFDLFAKEVMPRFQARASAA